MRDDACTGAEQCANHYAAGCVTHVVGVGFEGKAPHGKGFAGQVGAVFGKYLVDQHHLLVVVHLFHGLQHAQALAVALGGFDEGFDVFGEAAAAVAGACVQKAVANAGV